MLILQKLRRNLNIVFYSNLFRRQRTTNDILNSLWLQWQLPAAERTQASNLFLYLPFVKCQLSNMQIHYGVFWGQVQPSPGKAWHIHLNLFKTKSQERLLRVHSNSYLPSAKHVSCCLLVTGSMHGRESNCVWRLLLWEVENLRNIHKEQIKTLYEALIKLDSFPKEFLLLLLVLSSSWGFVKEQLPPPPCSLHEMVVVEIYVGCFAILSLSLQNGISMLYELLLDYLFPKICV